MSGDDDRHGLGGIGDVNRRRLLVALGGGSALAVAGQGSVSSQEGEGPDGTPENETEGTPTGEPVGEQCDPCIDSYSGYLVPGASGQDEPQEFDPAVTVELRVTDADVVFVETPEGDEVGETDEETPAPETPGSPTPTDEEGNRTQADGDEANGTPTPTPGEGGGPGGQQSGFPDFYFDPVGIQLRPGDTVAFDTREELHTVTAYHPRFFGVQQRVPAEVPGFSSPPVVEDDIWYYRFEQTGVYDIQCLPHEGLGMVMRAVVLEEESDDVPDAPPEPGEDEVGPSSIAQTVLNAPELEPQNIVDQETVAWDQLTNVESEPPTG